MRHFANEEEAITYVFRSMRKLRGQPVEPDEIRRSTRPTQHLLGETGLLSSPIDYAVITGSKGKGSTAVMLARLLRELGHTVGLMTSPHLVTYRERIRVNGRAIPEADLLRLLGELSPAIDALEATLPADRYFSPQGIFLAVALRWFNEHHVRAAVLEVGRGGRFDDIAVVPNKLSLFTPILLEHTQQLGPTLERIAWHKAGIIKPTSYAYSVPQATTVLDVLQREADRQGADFFWIAPMDMGRFVSDTPTGQRMRLGRYGELDLPLLGRYQVANATLAVQGAGNMHGRLGGISHGSTAYVERIRAGLAGVVWPGRLQKLGDHPQMFIDGAIHQESARSVALSLEDRVTEPVVAVVGVPADKDYRGVYTEMGLLADHMILTQTDRNNALHWLDPDEAVSIARRFNPDTTFAPTVEAALDEAVRRAGRDGTIVIVGTQSVLADVMLLRGETYEVI